MTGELIPFDRLERQDEVTTGAVTAATKEARQPGDLLWPDPVLRHRAAVLFAAAVYRAARECRLRELGRMPIPEPTAEEWDIYTRSKQRRATDATD